jgi:hypothetical protein
MRFRNPIYSGLGLVRKRPGASLRSPFNVGLGSRRAFYPGIVDCPEAGATISFENCLRCPKYAVWNVQDGEFKRCWHEYKALEERGYYDEEKWMSHLETTDPETFERIQEEKRINAEFAADFEREKAEMARLAEELARAEAEVDGEDEEDGEEPDRAAEDEDEY